MYLAIHHKYLKCNALFNDNKDLYDDLDENLDLDYLDNYLDIDDDADLET